MTTTNEACFFYMVVTTFQILFGIRMHHSAAPTLKNVGIFQATMLDRVI
jgi:hypothetical protein